MGPPHIIIVILFWPEANTGAIIFLLSRISFNPATLLTQPAEDFPAYWWQINAGCLTVLDDSERTYQENNEGHI